MDDWEFPNYGSYIAFGGHCAGQSVTAMWYYYEKKSKGAPNLHSNFDHYGSAAPATWADNPRGFKFASQIQADMKWDEKSIFCRPFRTHSLSMI